MYPTAPLQGMNCVKTSTPLAPSTAHNTAATQYYFCHPATGTVVVGKVENNDDYYNNKENEAMATAVEISNNNNNTKTPGGWLSKVCSKLLNKQRGQERCEKCGHRSDTCRPNPSFAASGRRHFLCQDCRAASRNMKTMYHQLCRNLSLRRHDSGSPRGTDTSGDLSPPGSCHGGMLSRSRSLKVTPTTTTTTTTTSSSPESGYSTATSVDSSCSERLSTDPGVVSTSSGECGGGGGGGRCSPCSDGLPAPSSLSPSTRRHQDTAEANHHACSKDRAEVFAGAFLSEKAHLCRLQPVFLGHESKTPPTRLCPPAVAASPPRKAAAPAAKAQQHPQHHHTPKETVGTKQYDGYLEIKAPNSGSVKYVFKKPEGKGKKGSHLEDRKRGGGGGGGGGGVGEVKECYRCRRTPSVAFRAPFGHGWLCEDCMDDLM